MNKECQNEVVKNCKTKQKILLSNLIYALVTCPTVEEYTT